MQFNMRHQRAGYQPWAGLGDGVVRVGGAGSVRGRGRDPAVVPRSRHLHEEFPQLAHLVVVLQMRHGPVLPLLDEVPQAHVVQELQTRKRGKNVSTLARRAVLQD